MPQLNKSTVNPGTILLGSPGDALFTGNVFKNVFRCRKKGLEFLGQVVVDSEARKVKWEMFNESYYDLFPCDPRDVDHFLRDRLLGQMTKMEQMPEMHRGVIREFLKKCRAEARQAALEFEEEPPPDERDLDAIFNRLNEAYFNGKVEAQVEWGKNVKTPNRRSFSFGSYDAGRKLIRIHPRLRQDFVPVFVLELTVYHEMCHQAFPPVKRNGQWQTHHKEFKAKEREYKNYREAMHWEKKHWVQLMAPVEE